MAEKYQFDDFLKNVSEEYKDFAKKIHEIFLQNEFKIKVENKASGFFVGYSYPQTKKSCFSFFFRKSGLFVRLYPDKEKQVYFSMLGTIPASMLRQIEKSSVCKRLINPNECNPKCVLGYDLQIGDKHLQKCRHGCFQFIVNDESIPFLMDFITKELG